MLYQHEKLCLTCYFQSKPRSLHHIAFALHFPLFSTLWMVCEYIQSTHGIALAINVVKLWRTICWRWFWRPGRLGVPPVMSLVGRRQWSPKPYDFRCYLRLVSARRGAIVMHYRSHDRVFDVVNLVFEMLNLWLPVVLCSVAHWSWEHGKEA